jgi:hypothetical protein
MLSFGRHVGVFELGNSALACPGTASPVWLRRGPMSGWGIGDGAWPLDVFGAALIHCVNTGLVGEGEERPIGIRRVRLESHFIKPWALILEPRVAIAYRFEV